VDVQVNGVKGGGESVFGGVMKGGGVEVQVNGVKGGGDNVLGGVMKGLTGG
jgi:hypothetical protein